MYQVSVPESSENTNVATPPVRFRLGWQVSEAFRIHRDKAHI